MPIFMCLRYKTTNHYSNDSPIFFYKYTQALDYAHKNCFIQSRKDKIHVYFVKIFKIPVKTHICLNMLDHHFHDTYLKSIYDPITTASMIIQKWWKNIYNKRVNCANIIKKYYKIAIANPNTQLCLNRLLHEFNSLT